MYTSHVSSLLAFQARGLERNTDVLAQLQCDLLRSARYDTPQLNRKYGTDRYPVQVNMLEFYLTLPRPMMTTITFQSLSSTRIYDLCLAFAPKFSIWACSLRIDISEVFIIVYDSMYAVYAEVITVQLLAY